MTTTDNQVPETETEVTAHTEPIPAPSDKLQYRAVGLLKGKYVPLEEGDLTRGTLITSDGTHIDAVVLGKLLGLLKIPLIDLDKEHLWVCYPRTRNNKEETLDEADNPPSTDEESESTEEAEEKAEELEDSPDSELLIEGEKPILHVQMAGIWEPETLQPDSPSPAVEPKPDRFSIRGEVIYQHKEAGWVMVKIVQKPRKLSEKGTYFNLKLLGFLPDKPVKNFWNLEVEREGDSLLIQDGERIAYLGKKKPKKGKPKKKGGGSGNAKQQAPTAAASPKEPPKLKEAPKLKEKTAE